jgi:effector-binding domain-containing protein
MIDKPQIEETVDQLTAVIHLIVPREEIQNVMGPGVGEVMATLAAQGIAATGPWFTHHFRKPTDTFDFEICIPVPMPVSATGRVKPGRLAARKVARTIYHGRYEGLAEAWGEFHAWIAASGHSPATDLWERYVVGPESSLDPAGWRTELNQPLLG